MTLFDVVYVECQGCPSPGTWRGWSSPIYWQKNAAQHPSVLPCLGVPGPGSMAAGDAGFSFLPSSTPCQPKDPFPARHSTLNIPHVRALGGWQYRAMLAGMRGKNALPTGDLKSKCSALPAGYSTAGHVSWPPDPTPPRNIEPAPRMYQGWGHGPCPSWTVQTHSCLLSQARLTGQEDPLRLCAPQPRTHPGMSRGYAGTIYPQTVIKGPFSGAHCCPDNTQPRGHFLVCVDDTAR